MAGDEMASMGYFFNGHADFLAYNEGRSIRG
jgi:hypothetical protein